MKKTKEMVVTFSRQRLLAAAVTTTVLEKPVEVVEEYKYLGTIFENLSEGVINSCTSSGKLIPLESAHSS